MLPRVTNPSSTSSVEPRRISTGGETNKFSGWYQTDSFTGTKYNPKGTMQVPDDGLNMYSKWDTYYTVIFDTQGGSTIPQQSVLEGNTASQPYNPTRAGFTFDGWYTDPGCTQKATFPYTVRSSVTFYAKWNEPYTVKYAVCIWGINQDVDENGNELGLTFGPATGADYRHDSKAHSSDKDCIHNMTWSEIIEQSKKDPHYFDACLENGCTHSVCLNITGTLKGASYSGQFNDGDGVVGLYNSINSDYRKWMNGYSSDGGWPASRIRATLTGQDDLTKTSKAGEDCLDAFGCLFAMFPVELRNGIVAKTVKSDRYYSGSNKTTYDKLWLFSGKEMFVSDNSNGSIHPNEGELYQRSKKLGITASESGASIIYNERGNAVECWLRSIDDEVGNVGNISSYGGVAGILATNASSLAPGFCLE